METAEAVRILYKHIKDCGMLMPIEWVRENGKDSSPLMEAFQMAIASLQKEENKHEQV